MEVLCKQCDREVPPEDVNVTADTAYCRDCGSLTKLSELVGAVGESGRAVKPSPLDEVNTSDIPRGCSSRNDGLEQTISLSGSAGCGTIAGLLFFCLFWNGIVSVFVLIALSSTLRHLGVLMPNWFPAPDMDGDDMGLGMTLFLWVFLTPFITVGLILLGSLLVAIVGHTRIRFSGTDGSVFTGVGPIGWRRKFDPRKVKNVRVGKTSWESNGERKPVVELESAGGKKIKFGSLLNDDSRLWAAAELRRLLIVEPAEIARRF
jgi:hypothetical protein